MANGSPPVRVLITGDRNWDCDQIAERVLCSLRDRYGPGITIVHGAAKGVDSAFASACDRLGVAHEPHPAEWGAYGNAAGPRRNQEMVASGITIAVAVHRDIGGSRGTKDCVARCHKASIPVYLINGNGREAVRIRGSSPSDSPSITPAPDIPPKQCPVCDGPALHVSGKFWSCPRCSVEFRRDG